ncbi:MAG: hypothetical protein QOE70_6319 [Chthoniobacter sp.]|jgi:hypothetical protein|nr:hypothetical protein [Chthoniobacter sp.]
MSEERYSQWNMETDPKKLRELRLNQPPMTSEEFWEQFKRMQEAASHNEEMARQPRSETPRVRED